MGVLGTGAAAGVTQVGMQAQQVGRQQAKQGADRAYVLQRQKEVRETRLKGLEEDDAAEAETALHVDGTLADTDRHPDTSPEQEHHSHSEPGEAADDAAGESLTYHPPQQPQSQHHAPPAVRHRLDVKA